MRKVIEAELEAPLGRGLRRLRRGRRSPPPRSARSTARGCHDGRDVAVKVQYPGVAQAVRADMQNLGMILRLMKQVAPGLDVKATAEEIRSADRRGARLRARGPAPALAGAHLPRPPVHRRARRRHEPLARARDRHRVRGGRRLRRDQGGATRRRATASARSSSASSSAACTATTSSPATRTRATSCCMDDGRVAFLDFGLFKVMPDELIELELACQRAGHEGDGERLHEIWSDDRLPRRIRTASGPTSCSRSSATRRGGTCSTRTSSSSRRSRRR